MSGAELPLASPSPEVALTRYRTALHTYRALGMRECVGAVLNNVGMTLTDLGGAARPRRRAGRGTGRILRVADVFDAMTTDRAYRHAFSTDDALRIMEEETGSAFDPELLELFVALVREDEIGTESAPAGIGSTETSAPLSGAAA